MISDVRLCVIGLGYVGLPLAVEFGKKIPTTGFDLNAARVAELRQGVDSTLEVTENELKAAINLTYATKKEEIARCNTFIIAVPTPIDAAKRPDFKPLIGASTTVGQVLKNGDVVIYESTVYPGATEEVCVPILAKESGLVFNRDFFCGYSPERINPGDKQHRLPTIVKITSGSTPETAKFVNELYGAVITAGTFPASSIKVAEAAKVIENTQRDVNIALVNELALIFNRLGINTLEVLEAASTKWNFLPFRPGLVGGHCIGVDPYYLTYKAQEAGYHPEMILAGRRLNDQMGQYVAGQFVKLLLKKNCAVCQARALIMGLTFKEDCPDLRNTKVVDIIAELAEYGIQSDVYDPWVKADEAWHEYRVKTIAAPEKGRYQGVIVAVAHRQFRDLTAADIRAYCAENSVIFDVKNILPRDQVDGAL
ncbi:MAG: nucleotide sugar dehydrogenase [Desulfobulbaceae bacterium]|jgi:UDP-N-acetyl-D-galactosamine dehydrogenase|nr:nucleotide sugar dehydrogenase [Desulfobulbaceae bacterium]